MSQTELTMINHVLSRYSIFVEPNVNTVSTFGILSTIANNNIGIGTNRLPVESLDQTLPNFPESNIIAPNNLLELLIRKDVKGMVDLIINMDIHNTEVMIDAVLNFLYRNAFNLDRIIGGQSGVQTNEYVSIYNQVENSNQLTTII